MLDLELGTSGKVQGLFDMIVVTAGTTEYRAIVDAQARKCAEFGYRHIIYDLGGLGIGTPYAVEREDLAPTVNGDSLPPATFKPALVVQAMGQGADDETVCWLDADCIPLKEFDPLAGRDDIDAAVTLRSTYEVGQSNCAALDFLNSGVVWIRNTERGYAFLNSWDSHTRTQQTDQGGLNLAVGTFSVDEWRRLYGVTVVNVFSGARILILDATEWNRWHLPPAPGTRILHFKRGIRGSAVNYL